jgi:hypothetical protein
MPYLKNSIINFDNRENTKYNFEDYFSIDFNKVSDYINSCPKDWFDWYQLQDNSKLEKVSLDIYGDADYWDILLVINKKLALFEMPYDYDAVMNMVDYKIAEYVKEVYKKDIPVNAYNAMLKKLKEKYIAENETYRVIKIVRPSKMQAFIQGGYEAGLFK